MSKDSRQVPSVWAAARLSVQPAIGVRAVCAFTASSAVHFPGRCVWTIDFDARAAHRHNLTVVTGNDWACKRSGLTVFNPVKALP